MKIAAMLTALLLVSSFGYANTVRIGNGGDTQADQTLTDQNITHAIYRAATDAQLLIHAWLRNPPFNLQLKKNQPLDLLNIIRTTPVDIIGYDGCSDGVSKKDAVAYSQPSNRICVSSLQLKSKLSSANYRLQILALMMHEYSHLIGFDEAAATEFQQYILRFIEFAGYPVTQPEGIDDFVLYNPYSIFEGVWSNKQRLSEDVTAYSKDLREKIQSYAAYTSSNYPLVPPQMDLTGDILLRLTYLDLVNKAYWKQPGDAELRKRLKFMAGHDGQVDMLIFNNSDINPTLMQFSRTNLTTPRVQDQKEADFKAFILQVDQLKVEMEAYMLSVLRPTPKFNYYPTPPSK
ncbi:hypothetical protein DOM22_11780 [Bdellovibrio sp. ZAP7]|uniref:hypothetical protein n=1 Tax=Bdellovibrio sp. ZAP7 TaxID=2231053 RepID=UPI001159236A|nr:hypothetical protein [Bdellovibrio sp. ZAP7]QDK45777.1 hypothetical protein DOM22_11780 [Bdellovibrio sp. ZAP7]